MRSLLSLSMVPILVMSQSAASSAEPAAAVRVEGYVGYATFEAGPVDEDAFQGGGAASVSTVFDRLYLQADVFGDAADFDIVELDTVGAGGHLGWRDPEQGSFGLAGAYNRLEIENLDTDHGRVGFEGELFLDRLTLAGNVGYSDLDGDSSGYLDLGASFYPVDQARVHVGGGVFDIEESDPLGTVNAGAEYLVGSFVSAFARWEAAFAEVASFDLEDHSIVFGARLYWGADQPTLLSYDRTRFKRTCSGVRLSGLRLC